LCVVVCLLIGKKVFHNKNKWRPGTWFNFIHWCYEMWVIYKLSDLWTIKNSWFNFSMVSPGNLCAMYSMHKPSLFKAFTNCFTLYVVVAGWFYLMLPKVRWLHFVLQPPYIPSEAHLFLPSAHVWLCSPKGIKSKDTLCSHFVDQEEN
jgi:hypothetical protein